MSMSKKGISAFAARIATGLMILQMAAMLTSCAGKPQKTEVAPVGLNTAVSNVAGALLEQTHLHSGVVAFVPVRDAVTGETSRITVSMTEQLVHEISAQAPQLDLRPLSRDSYQQARYIMVPVAAFELYAVDGCPPSSKLYRLHVSIVEKSSRMTVAHADAWVAGDDLNFAPTPLYENSPMYPKDSLLASSVAIAHSSMATAVDNEHFRMLDINAVLNEASQNFEQGDYEHAAELFQDAASRPDGQLLMTYIGLYRSDIKLRRVGAANEAFVKLLALGVKDGELSIKFLFDVNSNELISDEDMRFQSMLWLDWMGKFFEVGGQCLEIRGHSSHTGSERYNIKLSLGRAKHIQELLKPSFPSVTLRTRAVGLGYSENIVGTGADDNSDIIDRRVEFKLVSCPLF